MGWGCRVGSVVRAGLSRRLTVVAALAVGLGTLAPSSPAGAYVYWANGGCCVSNTPSIGTIGRANNDGTGVNQRFINPPGNSTNLQGLAAGSSGIFWADAAGGTVGHAGLDGSSPNNSFIADSRGTDGVASDSQFVFWGNFNAQTIFRANVDGSSPGSFSSASQVGQVIGMTDVSGRLYWANNANGTIGSSPTGSASASPLLTVPTPIGGSTPNVQFVAVGGGFVYWTDTANKTIGRASLSSPSTTANDSFITGVNDPRGIAVDSSHIYWSNSGQDGTTTNQNSIGRANLDGSGVSQTFITGGSVPYGLAVDDLGITGTSVACSPPSEPTGQATTCTATVANTDALTPATPAGPVTFTTSGTGAFSSSSCSLSGTGSSASCRVTYTPSAGGPHTITTRYGGDSNHQSSSALAIVTAASPGFAPNGLFGPGGVPTALLGPKRDVLRDLGITRHRLIKTAKNGDFVFPPDPIFLRAGDMLSAVVKLNVGRRHGKKGKIAVVTTYGTGNVTATHDGPAQLTIHATPAGRSALRRNGRVFVSVHLAFRSSAKLGSTSSSKDFRVKLSKKRGK